MLHIKCPNCDNEVIITKDSQIVSWPQSTSSVSAVNNSINNMRLNYLVMGYLCPECSEPLCRIDLVGSLLSAPNRYWVICEARPISLPDKFVPKRHLNFWIVGPPIT